MQNVLLAMGRFLRFFFALLLTLTVVIAVYSGVATAPISQTWDAVKALVITAVVLLMLALACGMIADRLTVRGDQRISVDVQRTLCPQQSSLIRFSGPQ